jgi:hypothetical protein
MDFDMATILRTSSGESRSKVGKGGKGGNHDGKGLGHAALGDVRAPAASQGGGASSGDAGGGGGKRSVIDQLATLGAKLSLQTAAAVADVAAVHSFVILAPSDSDMVNSIAAATAHYHTLTAGKKGQHNHGPPDIFAAKALFTVALTFPIIAGSPAKVKVITDNLAEMGTDVNKWVLSVVKCRLRKAYAENTSKVEIILTGKLENTKILLIDAIMQMDTMKIKIGRAPKSNLERQVAAALDRLSKMQ